VVLNAQFAAAVLRLTDILDFDRERTPRVLFESLGIESRVLPGSELSLLEWQKHMAVHTLEFATDEVIVTADSHNPVIEKTIREFCAIIEREIRDTLAVLRRNPNEITSRYQLELPISVRPHIRSVGYIYKDMAFTLNQTRIMTLLMGQRLFSSPASAVRELIQNSVDACSARLELEGDAYAPDIDVSARTDVMGRRWLEVRDNGLGMDEHVLSEYFLKLGNSYYQSPEFGRLSRTASFNCGRPFVPISRFGIGLASTFMIGDVVEVVTRNQHSPRRDHQARRVRVDKLGTLVFMTDAPADTSGTLVSVRLLPQLEAAYEKFVIEVERYLRDVVIGPRFPVTLRIGTVPTVLRRAPSIVTSSRTSEVLGRRDLELITLDVSRWSDSVTGTVAILFAKTPTGLLSHLKDGKYLRLGHTLDPSDFPPGYSGNRISVNGFRMSQKKASRLLGKGKSRLALLLDVDFQGDDAIEYDISRDRVVRDGASRARLLLGHAIYAGLRDTGILDRLEPLTRGVLESPFDETSTGFVLQPGSTADIALLEKVEALVPNGPWPTGLHKKIATELSISNGQANRALSHLIATGRLHKPL
jgi:molecular chaperone HtpG